MKEITVNCSGLMPRWQSIKATRSTSVVDLPEPAPAKIRVSGYGLRIIAHCSSEGALSNPAVHGARHLLAHALALRGIDRQQGRAVDALRRWFCGLHGAVWREAWRCRAWPCWQGDFLPRVAG